MHPATVIRKACERNGVKPAWGFTFFSDKRKNGTKRVKLYNGNALFHASQKQQKAIDRELRAAFGDAFISAYFIEVERSWHTNAKSFCVRLKL